MKKIFTILLLLAAFVVEAQPYNNEWIDFSKQYFKFKVATNGVYRIPESVLSGAGLANVQAQSFQLFRNGQEVPIYTSVASGLMGPTDYIEFWGQMNDGKPDKALYRSPTSQHTTQWSLETDTAVYFLTVNTTVTPFHYLNATNDTTGNVLPVEPYLMYTAGVYNKYQINPGYAADVGEYVYSSSYDIGEFWAGGNINGTSSVTDNTLTNLNVYPGGPNASLKFGLVGDASNLRTVQASINNFVLVDTEMDNFSDLLTTENVPLSNLSSGNASVQFQNNCTNPNDWIVSSFFELTYPRFFNFNGAANFPFQLPGRGTGYLLKITGFNSASTPVLYDMTTGARYAAIVAAGNIFYFELPASASTRNFVMVSEDASNISTVTSLTPKTFVNFANSANQGNYIIISNPLLYTGANGNPIVEYKNYRSSAAGGGFSATVVDINELLDQFSFGIKFHPSSIKNFLNYARNTFAVKPQFVFLIGHGVTYDECRGNENSPLLQQLELVPTFGYPASDNKLSSLDAVQTMPLTPIGRLSAISGIEVETYLAKVQEYELLQQTSPNTIAGRAWMKNVVHVTGASDPYLGAVLCNYMASYQQIIQDTLFGATVSTFCNGNVQVSNFSNTQLANLFSSGISILNYFGHSSASTLQDNLDDPANYATSQGKYPAFYVNGCNAGDFFIFDQGRILGGSKTLSETWVLAKEKGAIAFVASTHFGIVNYLNILLNGLYNYIGITDYGKSMGKIQADAVQNLINVAPTDYYARLHAEEMTLHGDPALKLNQELLPDYDVESAQVSVSPAFVSVSNNSFTVNATIYNLGKAVSDSIIVTITRTYPDGSKAVVYNKKIAGILYNDSIQVVLPIVATRDKGQNAITVSVNIPNVVPEITYQNNSATTNVFIYQDEATPIYPYNYAIVSNSTQKLYASTANPFALSTQYVMEIDTTEAFNSPLLISKFLTQVGGVLEFDPGISYHDSTVYYWRVSIVPAQGGQYLWNEFSFIYINASVPGFNQSHYYQHLQSVGDSISLLTDRQWHFGTQINNLYIRQTMYGYGGNEAQDFSVTVNNNMSIESACLGQSLVFNVFNPITFQPWSNVDANGNSLYLYGSASASCGGGRQNNFEFSYMTPASRKTIMNFMDSIPAGYWVVVRSFDYDYNNSFSSTWEGDTTLYGSNNSLYSRLLQAGFTQIDSINQPRAWALVYKKGDPSFVPQQAFTASIYDRIVVSANCPSPDLLGYVVSPKFGPAKAWKQVHWRGYSLESPSTDSVGLQVIGIDTLGNANPLYNLNLANQDFDISAISAVQYPYVQLKLTAIDSVHATPYQLQYWRLNYDPVPEGAIAPNLFFVSKDTVSQGQQFQFGIAFKNVSITAFDSMTVSMSIIDHNNVTHVIPLPKRKPLISGDTLMITYTIDTKAYPGLNTIYLNVNPHTQPEEYFFNNFVYRNFYVRSENSNPLLDVTFDGVHILNQDIVSAKPHILIKLKDQSQYLLLTDTSEVNVQLRYPDGSLHAFNYGTDTLRFTPAASSADNTATVDFTPAFTKQYNPQGDVYELIVTGKNAYGNPAGAIQFEVAFTIITKPMISNMLNYPNPFTTSTAFVFTITGSQVPQNIKIEILTITGKVVREITEDELGPLHIGRNITEFKWNGTDGYGQRLANGVYIYRVVTNLNGKSLDKYTATGDNTAQYFVNGYGKMYLMGK